MTLSVEELQAASRAQAERAKFDAEKAAEEAAKKAQLVGAGLDTITFYHRHPGATYIESTGEGQHVKHIFPPDGLVLHWKKDEKLIMELAAIVDKSDVFLMKPLNEDPKIQEALDQARQRAERAHDTLSGKK